MKFWIFCSFQQNIFFWTVNMNMYMYMYANEWGDDLIASQFSINFASQKWQKSYFSYEKCKNGGPACGTYLTQCTPYTEYPPPPPPPGPTWHTVYWPGWWLLVPPPPSPWSGWMSLVAVATRRCLLGRAVTIWSMDQRKPLFCQQQTHIIMHTQLIICIWNLSRCINMYKNVAFSDLPLTAHDLPLTAHDLSVFNGWIHKWCRIIKYN